MTKTNDIETRKQRWRDLYAIKSSGHRFLVGYGPDALPAPPRWPSLKAERIGHAWDQYERHLARAEWLDDDSIPHIAIQTGTEIFAEAFGCPIYRPEDNLPFARPLITSPAQVGALAVPDLGASSLAVLFDMADELLRRAGGKALFKLVDIQSPMGIAAIIWEKSDFYVAMHEAPEAVKELSSKTRSLLEAFLDEWFARYGTEFIAHCPSYFMPAGITLSEDEIGSVSPGMFEEFFLPDLERLSARYGGMGIHCCARSRHQWENFLKVPDLRMLNLSLPPDEMKDALRYFAPHVAQMPTHKVRPPGPPWTWPAAFPAGSKIVMDLYAGTRDEAVELCGRMREACAAEVEV